MGEHLVMPEGPQSMFYICRASWRYRTGSDKPGSGYDIFCPVKKWVENNDPVTHLQLLREPVDLKELAKIIYNRELKDHVSPSDERMDDIILPDLKWVNHYLVLGEVPPGYVEGIGPDHCGDFLMYIRGLTPDEQDTFWETIYSMEYIPDEGED